MATLLVHRMDSAWTSSNPALLQVLLDSQRVTGEGTASNRLIGQAGANNVVAEFVPPTPLDLNHYEELRLWILANRSADGSTAHPFYLEFSYTDANDTPTEEHRWLVPIYQVNTWEHLRIGIQSDRRSAINRFRFRCLTDLPFVCNLAELLAVQEEMFADLEEALVNHISRAIFLPGLTNILLSQPAQPNDTQITLPLTSGFQVGNRLLLRHGNTQEVHSVVQVTSNSALGTTILNFAPSDQVQALFPSGIATASVVVPAIVETPPESLPQVTPAIIVTPLDIREDAERTPQVKQQDSYRSRGNLIVCSLRSSARAYVVDYQITVIAPERSQQRFIYNLLLQRLSIDIPIRINGVPSPVWNLPQPPTLPERRLGLLAPLYVRIGTRLETDSRREVPLVQQTEVRAGRIDAPLEQEGIVLEL